MSISYHFWRLIFLTRLYVVINNASVGRPSASRFRGKQPLQEYLFILFVLFVLFVSCLFLEQTSMNVKKRQTSVLAKMLFVQTQMVHMNATARKVITTQAMDVKISMNATLVLRSVMKQPQNAKTQLEVISACVEQALTRLKTNVLVSLYFLLFSPQMHSGK